MGLRFVRSQWSECVRPASGGWAAGRNVPPCTLA